MVELVPHVPRPKIRLCIFSFNLSSFVFSCKFITADNESINKKIVYFVSFQTYTQFSFKKNTNDK